MSNIRLSFPTVHRIPDPNGAGIKISATASGLGALAITETFNAGSLGSSVATMGVWANVDLTSVATSGQLAKLGLIDRPENTLIFTEYGPLTNGQGDGKLATVDDVTVLVNGTPTPPVAIDPVAGILIMGEILEPGDAVLIDYSYVDRPTLPFAALNNSNYLLNQFGTNAYAHPFAFNTVLGPGSGPDVGERAVLTPPEVVGHQWTAFDYEYSAVLNDPTSLVLNEPSQYASLPPFKRDLKVTSVFFEGDDNPVGFTYTGPTLGAATFTTDNLYIVEDASTGTDNAQGLASLFRQTLDLSYEASSSLNWRLRALSYTADGVFTGITAGWSDDERAYLVGFLELSGGFLTAGILSDAGDETLVDSWSGLTSVVENPNGPNTQLRFTTEPPFALGARLWSEGTIYTVLDIDDQGVDGFTVTVDVAFPATGPVELFLEVDFTMLRSYRAAKTSSGEFALFLAGFETPIASVAQDDAAIAPEIFALLRNNSLFFGSASRRAVSTVGWDFVRFAVTPDQGTESAQVVSVTTDMVTLPEDNTPPWYLAQNQGYARTLPGDLVLQQSAGQPVVGQGYAWSRVEPFIDQASLREITFKVRVTSWAQGMASTVILADEKRQMTLSLFDENAPAQYQGQGALAKSATGFWQFINGISLSTQGHLDGYNAPLPGAFLYAYGGVTSPTDAGFTSTFDADELSYYDHRLVITHDGAPASATGVEVGRGSITEWVCATRLAIKDYTLTADNLAPFFFGVDDGEYVVYLAPYDDGTPMLVLVDSTGALVLDGGNPVGVNYDWTASTELTHFKLVRYGDNLSVFADGVYVGLIDVLLAPVSTAADVQARFGVLDGQGTFEVDYFYAHQAAHGNRRVGLYTGSGDILDANQYTSAPAEFFGSFLDVRVRINKTSIVEVFLGGSSTPSLTLPYNQLPLREDLTNVDTDLGYVLFGTLDPAAYTDAQWDRVNYILLNRREDQRTLPNAVLNYSNTLTSPEPVEDLDPEQVLVTPYTATILRPGQVGMFADRVLSVTSQDGLTAYTYTYDRVSNEITLDTPLTDLTSPLRVTLYHRRPFGKGYLENNRPVIRLGEGTPPFALTHQAQVTASVEFNSQLNDQNDLLNSDEDFILNDAGTSVVFRRKEDSFLASLDLCSTVQYGEQGLVSAACDKFVAITLEDPYEDTYTFPDQGDENPRTRGRLLQLNNPNTVLNSPEGNLANLASAVTLLCEITYTDEVGAVTDEALTGGESVLTDFYGSGLLNNPKATLNTVVNTPGDVVHEDSVVFTLNTQTTSDQVLDFVTTVNFP